MTDKDNTPHHNIHHRVDIQDIKIDNINESIQHMSVAVDKLTESVHVISEAVVKIAANQEALQVVSEETRNNTKDTSDLKGTIDVLEEKVKQIPKLVEEVDLVKTRQTKNNVVISIMTTIGTLTASGVIAWGINQFLG